MGAWGLLTYPGGGERVVHQSHSSPPADIKKHADVWETNKMFFVVSQTPVAAMFVPCVPWPLCAAPHQCSQFVNYCHQHWQCVRFYDLVKYVQYYNNSCGRYHKLFKVIVCGKFRQRVREQWKNLSFKSDEWERKCGCVGSSVCGWTETKVCSHFVHIHRDLKDLGSSEIIGVQLWFTYTLYVFHQLSCLSVSTWNFTVELKQK